MNNNLDLYQKYFDILKEELIISMGCTEPVAIAYCAARAKDVLCDKVVRVAVEASGNLIKNAKSVVVPNTGGLCGIKVAAAAGIVAGRSQKLLEVLNDVTEAQKAEIAAFVSDAVIDVAPADSDILFDIKVTVYSDKSSACVRICDHHTNVVYIEKDGNVIFDKTSAAESDTAETDKSFLSVHNIFDFAENADILQLKAAFEQQYDYNMAIAQEGLRGSYGAQIGKIVLKSNPGDVKSRCIAMAAAASDARMSGCEMGVVINSGSGNQGITSSVPVIVYATEKGFAEEKMYRALAVSALVTVYQKSFIGKLSAFCGAVSAGAASAAAIAYLEKNTVEAVEATLINTLAVTSGLICDGAKASCAGKIATALEAGFRGYEMYCNGYVFCDGDGIIKSDCDKTVQSVGRLAKQGMNHTDKVILDIMTSM